MFISTGSSATGYSRQETEKTEKSTVVLLETFSPLHKQMCVVIRALAEPHTLTGKHFHVIGNKANKHLTPVTLASCRTVMPFYTRL